jgi:hypothetical protein
MPFLCIYNGSAYQWTPVSTPIGNTLPTAAAGLRGQIFSLYVSVSCTVAVPYICL